MISIDLPYTTYAQISRHGQRWLYVAKWAAMIQAPCHVELRSDGFKQLITVKRITEGPKQDLPVGSAMLVW